jgi:hypothetical protein
LGGSSYYAYRTYAYVQHDKDFCLSCHLMEEPYQRFARSAHGGLGCKACHQPTLLARSTMALTQVVERPEELSAHAEVPNERCAECHVDGDPAKWRLIAYSAGHKAHLESVDPRLEGLECVECHSTSLHEFAPVDRTCAQAGCHEDRTIRLGRMSDLTMHCLVCHSFVAPVNAASTPASGSVEEAILPDQDECLSCHAMRTLVAMPSPDPHRGVCASCHDPHRQTTPAEAGGSCTNAGCHGAAAALTPFHRGLSAGALENCVRCHGAHDFALDGNDCASCHADVASDSVSIPTPRAATSGGGPQEGFLFLHSEHGSVGCVSCHRGGGEHGGLAPQSLQDCRGCHHAAPLSRDCARCHESSEVPARTFRVPQQMSLSVSGSVTRTFSLSHQTHATLDCASCHEGGPDLPAASVRCTTCHEDHHQADSDCTACHDVPLARVHPAAQAHLTCSGAGCHQATPFQGTPTSRSACLLCHRDRGQHQPGRECRDCHAL